MTFIECPITKPFIVFLIKMLKRRKGQLYVPKFTGLYAFYRPYWLETEDDGIKKFTTYRERIPLNPIKVPPQNIKNYLPYGEDAYLRDCMAKKYRVIHLDDVGGIVLRPSVEICSAIEFLKGEIAGIEGVSFLNAVFLQLLINQRFQYFRGYCFGRRVRNDLDR